MLRCENCRAIIHRKVAYNEWKVLCLKCLNDETQLDCTLLSEDLIDFISEEMTEIEDPDEDE